MPGPRRKRSATARCTYKEGGGRRCPFDGTGDPPLCNAHRVALAEIARPKPPTEILLGTLVDLLQGKPINREATIGAAEDFLSQWAGGLGADYRPDIGSGQSEDSVHRHGQAGAGHPWWWDLFNRGSAPGSGPARDPRTRQPPPPDPRAELRKARQAARVVLGFGPGDAISDSAIKTRHRELVRRHHPDRGGSTKKMAAINAARDVLLAELAGE